MLINSGQDSPGHRFTAKCSTHPFLEALNSCTIQREALSCMNTRPESCSILTESPFQLEKSRLLPMKHRRLQPNLTGDVSSNRKFSAVAEAWATSKKLAFREESSSSIRQRRQRRLHRNSLVIIWLRSNLVKMDCQSIVCTLYKK